jgi:RNA polymerase sigma-70 factor (ECF subfamily)
MTAVVDQPHRAPDADAQLAEGCRRGSVAAFERLYREHGARMKSIAWNLLGSQGDAEDAVQETFLKVFRAADGFGGHSSFATWVYRILVNTCRDMQRSRARKAETQMAEGVPEPAGRANPALKMALERALAGLNPRYREVFLLAEAEGLRHAEIAVILNIPEGTSKNWLFEAKKALRQAL